MKTKKYYKDLIVYSNGTVFSKKSKKFYSLNRTNGNGYINISIHENGKWRNIYIHRLVATLFCNNPNNYKEVNHIDGNKKNNNYRNLEWTTRAYNTHHSYVVCGRKVNFKEMVAASTKANSVPIKDKFGNEFTSQTSAAKFYNLSASFISHMILGKCENRLGLKRTKKQ